MSPKDTEEKPEMLLISDGTELLGANTVNTERLNEENVSYSKSR